jgi:hypothetical protein
VGAACALVAGLQPLCYVAALLPRRPPVMLITARGMLLRERASSTGNSGSRVLEDDGVAPVTFLPCIGSDRQLQSPCGYRGKSDSVCQQRDPALVIAHRGKVLGPDSGRHNSVILKMLDDASTCACRILVFP